MTDREAPGMASDCRGSISIGVMVTIKVRGGAAWGPPADRTFDAKDFTPSA